MNPVKTADATIVYKAPASLPECGDLWCHRVRLGIIRTTWEPTEQELELLKQGGRIQLTLAHEPIPPIEMEVMAKEVTEPVAEHGWRINKEPNTTPPQSTNHREEQSNGESHEPTESAS